MSGILTVSTSIWDCGLAGAGSGLTTWAAFALLSSGAGGGRIGSGTFMVGREGRGAVTGSVPDWGNAGAAFVRMGTVFAVSDCNRD